MFFVQKLHTISKHAPKITKHGRCSMQNNQLLTKSHVELEEKSIVWHGDPCKPWILFIGYSSAFWTKGRFLQLLIEEFFFVAGLVRPLETWAGWEGSHGGLSSGGSWCCAQVSRGFIQHKGLWHRGSWRQRSCERAIYCFPEAGSLEILIFFLFVNFNFCFLFVMLWTIETLPFASCSWRDKIVFISAYPIIRAVWCFEEALLLCVPLHHGFYSTFSSKEPHKVRQCILIQKQLHQY